MGWDCPRCTFKNSNESPICDMCEADAPAGARSGGLGSDDGDWVVTTSKGKGRATPKTTKANQRILPQIINTAKPAQAVLPLIVKPPVTPTNKPKTNAVQGMRVVGLKGNTTPDIKPKVAKNQSVVPVVAAVKTTVASPVKSLPDTISCPMCTLENPSNQSFCDACGSTLPLHGQKFQSVKNTKTSNPQPKIVTVKKQQQAVLGQVVIGKTPNSKGVVESSSDEWVPVSKKLGAKAHVNRALETGKDFYSSLLKSSVPPGITNPKIKGAPYRDRDDALDDIQDEPSQPDSIILDDIEETPNTSTWRPSARQEAKQISDPLAELDLVPDVVAPTPPSNTWSAIKRISPTVEKPARKLSAKATPTSVPPAESGCDFPSDLGDTPEHAHKWVRKNSLINAKPKEESVVIPESTDDVKQRQAKSPPSTPINKLMIGSKMAELKKKQHQKQVMQAAKEVIVPEPVPSVIETPSYPVALHSPGVGRVPPPVIEKHMLISTGKDNSPVIIDDSELFKREKRPPKKVTDVSPEVEVTPMLETLPESTVPENQVDIAQGNTDGVVLSIPTELPPTLPINLIPDVPSNPVEGNNAVFQLLQLLNYHRVCIIRFNSEETLHKGFVAMQQFLGFSFQFQDMYLPNKRVAMLAESGEHVWQLYTQLLSSNISSNSIAIIEADDLSPCPIHPDQIGPLPPCLSVPASSWNILHRLCLEGIDATPVMHHNAYGYMPQYHMMPQYHSQMGQYSHGVPHGVPPHQINNDQWGQMPPWGYSNNQQ